MTRVLRCAYLTMDSDEGWCIDADLGFPPLEALGWTVEPVRWRSDHTDWDAYDAVYIGTSWDYPAAPQQFLDLLEMIDASRAVLVNELALVRWSMSKTYLRDLAERGTDIVPSAWFDDYEAEEVAATFHRFDCGQIIVKPVVSTNATDTFLLDHDRLRALDAKLASVFARRGFVVQPFIDGILEDGEYSLFYFDANLSHAIRKTPKQGDFRVQEEFGAQIDPIVPAESLVAAGDRVLSMVEPVPAYARADFVRGGDGRFLLMELELIEPSMYLRMHKDAPRRFAEAFDKHARRAIAARGETS